MARAAQAGLDRVQEVTAGDEIEEQVRRAATLLYEGYLAAQTALSSARRPDEDADGFTHQLSEVLRAASEAERDVVLDARKTGEFTSAAPTRY